eukprot:1350794-Amphidinium_carterae.1
MQIYSHAHAIKSRDLASVAGYHRVGRDLCCDGTVFVGDPSSSSQSPQSFKSSLLQLKWMSAFFTESDRSGNQS